MSKKAIIVGAGIAGLAASLRLTRQGYKVSVFEKNPYAGGKMHELAVNGYRFDTGPSLFTLPFLVDELFALFNERPSDYFTYTQKEVLCHYFWKDGTFFAASADENNFIQSAADTFGESPEAIQQYLANSKLKYDATAPLFLHQSLHRLNTYLSKDTLSAILKIPQLNLFNTLHATNLRYFKNKKLIQLFDRYATYNGSSPYKTPGIMSLIPHLEMHLGTYFPKGGIKSIANSLYALAVAKGVDFHFEEATEQILHTQKKVTGIKTNKGEYAADVVVSNADVFNSYQQLLKEVPAPYGVLKQERSSSALIFYWGINRSFDALDLHNIFFSHDYQQEFDEIFHKKTIPSDPTIYINITSKEEKSDAPPGCENWFVMINTAGNEGQQWNDLIPLAKQRIVQHLNQALNTDIEQHIVFEAVLDPREIERKTGSHRGSLYGASSNSAFAAFLRHANFSSSVKGLYFCGGSVHPGGGIPLCLLSAKIVADLLQHESA